MHVKKIFSFILLLCGNYINAQSNFIQNIYTRNYVNLDGRWHYIVDVYETGFRGFQGVRADEEENLGGFFENKQQQSK